MIQPQQVQSIDFQVIVIQRVIIESDQNTGGVFSTIIVTIPYLSSSYSVGESD